jgi:hypothetical protein
MMSPDLVFDESSYLVGRHQVAAGRFLLNGACDNWYDIIHNAACEEEAFNDGVEIPLSILNLIWARGKVIEVDVRYVLRVGRRELDSSVLIMGVRLKYSPSKVSLI